jgi:hypothetical protein
MALAEDGIGWAAAGQVATAEGDSGRLVGPALAVHAAHGPGMGDSARQGDVGRYLQLK